MLAVDTNVLVRLLTGDDPSTRPPRAPCLRPSQSGSQKRYSSKRGWVLRSLYGFEESAIRGAFTKLLGLKNVHAEDESSLVAALALTECGMELADAMHLSSRPPGARFVSFDKASFSARNARGPRHFRRVRRHVHGGLLNNRSWICSCDSTRASASALWTASSCRSGSLIGNEPSIANGPGTPVAIHLRFGRGFDLIDR